MLKSTIKNGIGVGLSSLIGFVIFVEGLKLYSSIIDRFEESASTETSKETNN